MKLNASRKPLIPPIPEIELSGKALEISETRCKAWWSIAKPPSPPEVTRPSTSTSNFIVSGSISGRDGKVLQREIDDAPALYATPAASTSFEVAGVSFTQIGTLTALVTAFKTDLIISSSFAILAPMSLRSMCGQDIFNSTASQPTSTQAVASFCQFCISSSLPAPAMIEAMTIRSGYVVLISSKSGSHKSSGWSEISSQFHEE